MLSDAPRPRCPCCTATFANTGLLKQHKNRYPNGSCDPVFPANAAPLQPSAPYSPRQRAATGEVQGSADAQDPETSPDIGTGQLLGETPSLPPSPQDHPWQAQPWQQQLPLEQGPDAACEDQHPGPGGDDTCQPSSSSLNVPLEFVRLVKRSKLHDAHVTSLLRLLKHPEFSADKLPFNDAKDVTQLVLEEGAEAAGLWVESTILVEGREIKFYHKDMIAWLEAEYGNASYKGSFVVHAARQERITGPQDAERWNAEQDLVAAIGAVVAALQLFSDKALVTFKGLSVYPIRGTLLNILLKLRIRALSLLGYVPKVDTTGLSSAKARVLQLRVLAACLHCLLESLKAISSTGRRMADPWGTTRLVIPRLLSYVCDTPERAAVLQMFDSQRAQHPCLRCHVLREDLADLSQRAELRTEASQQQLYADMLQAASDAERSDLSRQASTHPLPSGAWGLGDICASAACEWMHDQYLGRDLYVVHCIKGWAAQVARRRLGGLGKGAGTKVLRELDRRMGLLPPYYTLRMPDSDYYVSGAKMHQACHHQTAAAVLPHVVNGLVMESDGRDLLTELACRRMNLNNKLRSVRHADGFTECSLQEAEQEMLEVDALMQEVAIAAGVNLATRKYHAQVHICDDIRSLGPPCHYDAQHYEGQMKANKAAYNATSKKHSASFQREMIEHHQELEAFQQWDAQHEEVQETRDTAWMRAHATGTHQLQVTGQPASLLVLSGGEPGIFMSQQRVQCSQRLLQLQPELQHLRRVLQPYVNRLASSSTQQHGLEDSITLYAGGCLSSLHEWAPTASVLQTVRCAPEFHGRSWLDGVCISTTPTQGQPHQQQYARLHALLNVSMHGQAHSLAFVRWFKRHPTADVLSRFGCVRLVPKMATLKGQELPMYDVVPLATIVRREWLVPDFKAAAQGKEVYHVSCFVKP